MAFLGIQGLKFSDVFEVQYLLNIGKSTMVLRQCGSQKLDPRGTFFNDGESISNNFCKLSRAQQNQIGQRFEQIEEKWTIAQSTVCHGTTIEYPQVNLNILFNNMIQTGNSAAIDGLNVQDGSNNFWEYFQKGMVDIVFDKFQHF